MSQKLIFLDIDGTLTEPGQNVPPDSALDAIRKAQNAGNKVFLCTGRNVAMLRPLLAYGFDGVVASAGGYVVCGDEVIYDHPMPPDEFRQAMEVLGASGVYRTVECLNNTYVDNGLGDFLSNDPSIMVNSEILRWREAMCKSLNMRPMEEYAGEQVYKIVVMCNQERQLDAARALLEDRYLFCIQDASAKDCVNGELIHRDFDKGQGIRRICQWLDVPVSHTYGFGDGMNDLEMFRTVGTSICMENGSPFLKKVASSVCPSVGDNGLYRAFQALGFFES